MLRTVVARVIVAVALAGGVCAQRVVRKGDLMLFECSGLSSLIAERHGAAGGADALPELRGLLERSLQWDGGTGSVRQHGDSMLLVIVARHHADARAAGSRAARVRGSARGLGRSARAMHGVRDARVAG